MSYVLAAMAARTCYECSSILDIGGYDSTDGCKDEDPDTGKLREIKVPDEDECYLCSKIINKATNAGTSNNNVVMKPGPMLQSFLWLNKDTVLSFRYLYIICSHLVYVVKNANLVSVHPFFYMFVRNC